MKAMGNYFLGMMNSAAVFILFISVAAVAQNVNVKDIKADGNDSTTIEIRKGDKALKNEVLWEVVDGNVDIAGEHEPSKKDARVQWKKACDSWKKELREDNKDNKILVANCGSATCASETEGTVCKSQANYKIKTRLN